MQAFRVAELSGERDFLWLLDDITENSDPEKELLESPRLTGAGIIEQADHFAVIRHNNQGALSLEPMIFITSRDRILIPFAETGCELMAIFDHTC